jgi:hypothetical protein
MKVKFLRGVDRTDNPCNAFFKEKDIYSICVVNLSFYPDYKLQLVRDTDLRHQYLTCEQFREWLKDGTMIIIG